MDNNEIQKDNEKVSQETTSQESTSEQQTPIFEVGGKKYTPEEIIRLEEKAKNLERGYTKKFQDLAEKARQLEERERLLSEVLQKQQPISPVDKQKQVEEFYERLTTEGPKVIEEIVDQKATEKIMPIVMEMKKEAMFEEVNRLLQNPEMNDPEFQQAFAENLKSPMGIMALQGDVKAGIQFVYNTTKGQMLDKLVEKGLIMKKEMEKKVEEELKQIKEPSGINKTQIGTTPILTVQQKEVARKMGLSEKEYYEYLMKE